MNSKAMLGEHMGAKLVVNGITYLRRLKNPRMQSPETDLINHVALWFQQVDVWRDRYLDDNTTVSMADVNENLIFIAGQLTEAM